MNLSTLAISSSIGTFVNDRRKALTALAVGATMLIAGLGAQPATAATLVPAASNGDGGATAGVIVDMPVNLMTTSANVSFGPSAF
jgi:hypothetical protein